MMTDTLVGVSPQQPIEPAEVGCVDDSQDRDLSPAELAAVEGLVRTARPSGIALTGPDGLLKAMTKTDLCSPRTQLLCGVRPAKPITSRS